MGLVSRVLRNATSNWLGYVVNALVTLLLTPFVLSRLGIEQYGIWIVISSLTGYYGLLDIGLRGGVTQFLTRSYAAGNREETSEVLSSAIVAMSVLGFAVLPMAVVASVLIPQQVEMPDEILAEVSFCILLVGGSVAIQMALSPFASVFIATQRFDLANLIGVSTRLASAAAIVLLLSRGFGLIALAGVTAVTTVVDFAIRGIVSRRLIPSAEVRISRASREQLRKIMTFGIWSFLIGVSQSAYLYFIPLLVGGVLSSAAVGYYGLAAGLWHQINGLFNPMCQVLYPAAAEIHVRSEADVLNRLFQEGTRILMLVVVSVVIFAAFWSRDFFALWIGLDYVSGSRFHDVAFVLQLLLLATVVGYSVNIGGQVLLGAGEVRMLALLKIGGATTALAGSAFLLGDLGLVAVPYSLVFSLMAFDVIGIAVGLKRRLGISFFEYLKHSVARLVAVGALLWILFYSLRGVWTVAGWFDLIAHGLLAAIMIVLVVGLVGFSRMDRQRFFFQPVREVFGPKD